MCIVSTIGEVRCYGGEFHRRVNIKLFKNFEFIHGDGKRHAQPGSGEVPFSVFSLRIHLDQGGVGIVQLPDLDLSATVRQAP